MTDAVISAVPPTGTTVVLANSVMTDPVGAVSGALSHDTVPAAASRAASTRPPRTPLRLVPF
jgi:hypothetical protein